MESLILAILCSGKDGNGSVHVFRNATQVTQCLVDAEMQECHSILTSLFIKMALPIKNGAYHVLFSIKI